MRIPAWRGLRDFIRRKLYFNPRLERSVITAFHRLYYDSLVYERTYWRGVPIWKCPLDLWIYQEILHEVTPDLIIETGTAHGGSALYFANLMDLIGRGEIVTIDIQERLNRPVHSRISYVHGSSIAADVVARVVEKARGKARVLVVLDSDHAREHVLAELRAFAPLVTPGSYVVVEDTNLNDHPVWPDLGPGPMEAVDEFLSNTSEFMIDDAREKFFLTFNPRGYLKRRSVR